MAEKNIPIFCRGSASPGDSVFNVEYNIPIGRAGVLVCPGDIMLGDDDGVVVNDVVEQVLLHEDREDYIRLMLSRGAALDGLYPMAPDTEKAFLEWPRGERGR